MALLYSKVKIQECLLSRFAVSPCFIDNESETSRDEGGKEKGSP